MPKTSPLPIEETRFKAKLKLATEKFGFREGIGQLTWELKGESIQGRFANRDGRKVFEYNWSSNGLTYAPLGRFKQDASRSDAYSEAVSLTLAGASRGTRYSRSNRSSYARGFLRADRADVCTSPTAYSCGQACINQNKKCSISGLQARQASSVLLSEAKTLRRSNPPTQTISSDRLKAVVEAEENKIKDLSYERAIVVDAQTGKVVTNKAGGETYVAFSNEEVEAMKGNIVTHNHPNINRFPPNDPRSKGYSFSDDDVKLAAVSECSEMRAVSAGYRHSMKPPRGGWNAAYYNKKLKPTYDKHYMETYLDYVIEIESGRMTRTQADADFHHTVMQRTSDELGLQYRREPIRR